MIGTKSLTVEDLRTLRAAKLKMENIGWAMEGLNRMGSFLDSRVQLLPEKQQQWLRQISFGVLEKVVQSNLFSMKSDKVGVAPLNSQYKAIVTSSGVLGGAFGATAFAVDLGLTTKMMMRSIMDIARSEGEDLEALDTQLACLQVFALGGKSKHDDSLDTGYFATRLALNAAVKGSTSKLVEGFLVGASQPMLRLLAVVASRFSIQVSEKFVAQAVPVIGAVGGGAINLAFIRHFQSMAHAHFAIRRLERQYGSQPIEAAYNDIEVQA
ncbi:EcsC family protein [Pricia sp. S334]|uniref:EcsC family protein n=1 Tax=Pricia mediterranea TaxID=3076079 RepID=A0ABU3L4M4_9FLAO|nr:EcsC family protein [Pricia sp. S334]MDT7828694.1 EcsC family protein [Pricia sp. S334]